MQRANFVEEAASSIAGVNGNGAVTIVAVDGLPRVSNVYGAGTVFIPYIIEDTVNKRMETGLGSVTAGVLTRLKPQTTWDNATSTYSNLSPAPLAFGSNPAAGTVRVRIALTAEAAAPVHPGMITGLSGQDPSWNQYPLSPHLGAHTGAGASISTNPGTEYHTYYRLDYPGQLMGMQCDVYSPNAAGLIRMALFDLGPDALPARKLAQTHWLDGATSGLKTASDPSLWVSGSAVWLTPGWYTLMYQTAYGITIRGLLNSNSTGGGPCPIGRTGPSYAGYKNILTNPGTVNGDIPEQFVPNGVGIDGSKIPWVGMKVQA